MFFHRFLRRQARTARIAKTSRSPKAATIESVEGRVYFADTAGNSAALARVIGTIPTTGVQINESVSTADKDDFYKLSVPTGSIKTVVGLRNLNSNADLRLYDATGTTLLFSSLNTGTVTDFVSKNLAPGTYIARVNLVGSVANNYILSLNSDSAGDTIGSPRDLGAIGSLTGLREWVDNYDSYDFYKFSLAKKGKLALGLIGLTGNADLQLYDSNKKILNSSEALGTTDEEIIENILLADTYYVRVSSPFGAVAKYQLKLEFVADPGDTVATAANLGSLGSAVVRSSDLVTSVDRDDYFKFFIGTSGKTTVRIEGMVSNANLELYNGAGTTLLGSSSEPGITADQITKSLPAGFYIARVRWVGPAGTAYDLKLYGPAVVNNDPGETILTARDLGAVGAAVVTFSDGVSVDRDEDFFRIKMNGNGIIRVQADGNPGIAIYDSAKTLLDYSNTGAVLYHGSTAKDYYIRVFANASTAPEVNYTLKVSNGAIPADGAGNNMGTAKDLFDVVGTTVVNDFIVSTFDHDDFYKITLKNPGKITASLSGMIGDLNVSISNASGVVLGTSASASRSTDTVSFTVPTAGVYFIRTFQGKSANGLGPGNNGTSSPYTLTITPPTDDTRASATKLPDNTNTVLNGSLGGTDHEDWYVITGGVFGTSVQLYPASDNCDLELYNSAGILLSGSYGTGTTAESVSASGADVRYIRVLQGGLSVNTGYQLQVYVVSA